MKSLLLVPFLLFSSLPVQAYSASGARCFEEVWREEYVPGSYNSRGYVRRWQEKVQVPCHRPSRDRRGYGTPPPTPYREQNADNNSCLEGSILGGLAGAAGGAALSRGEGNFIGIPLGILGGALIGCQIDGG